MISDVKNERLDIFTAGHANIKVIPDNDYLPFVSVKEVLEDMNVGDITVWPLSKNTTLKVTISRLRKELGREYRTYARAKEGIKICRFA